jgi:hypothetical protein
VVDEVDRLVDLVVVGDVDGLEAERVASDVAHVGEAAGLEVVDADHAVTARQQVVAQVRTEEPGTARDERGGHPVRADSAM